MQDPMVGVAGLGLLGRGIAACLVAHNIPVIAYALSQQEFDDARAAIAFAIKELIDHEAADPSLQSTWQTLYTEAASLPAFAACTFVVESIIEDAESKIKLFAELEKILSATTPVASNTSSIPISLMQKACQHPERFLGMHWAEPAYATRFLELIRGDHTNDASMKAATELGLCLGKDPCVVQKDIPGFIANRIGYAMYREACNLLANGIGDVETIDRSFRNSVGLWASICGPFQWIDLTGGAPLYGKAMAGVLPTLSNAAEVPEPINSMMRNNDTGMRSGQGFYSYTPEQSRRQQERYAQHVWRVREIVDEAFPLTSEGE